MDSDASSPSRRTKRSSSPTEQHPGDTEHVRHRHAIDPEDGPAEPGSRLAKGTRYVPTLAEIRDHWPATVDVATAGAVFGLSRSHSYELIKRGEFPVKVIQIGSRYRVLTESILRVISDEPPPEPEG